MIETLFLQHFEANILLYHIVSIPQFQNFRLMPHLVVGGHICSMSNISAENTAVLQNRLPTTV